MTKAAKTAPSTEESAKLPKEKFDELETFINGLKTTDGALIEILHKAQHLFGYLPNEVQLFISRKLGIPGAEVYGVVSFYSYFTTQPRGKHTISVCMGTACFVRGADTILNVLKDKLNIDVEGTTEDGLFTLNAVRCIGACGLAPVVMVDDNVYGRVTENEIDNILNTYRNS